MLFTTYQSAPLALLLAFPNWDKSLTVDLELPANVDKGLSSLETRRVFASTSRYTLTYESLFTTAAESTQYRLFLQRLKGELVAVPMWTDAGLAINEITAGSTTVALDPDWLPVRCGAEFIILNDDGSVWEIVSGTLAGSTLTLNVGTQHAWASGTFIYPLLFGRFDDSGQAGSAGRPKPEWITDETTTSQIKIKESSAYTHRLSPVGASLTLVGSQVPALGALPLWTIPPNFGDRPNESSETDVLFKSVGFLRQDQEYVYTQGNRRTLELPLQQTSRNDIAAAERIFVDRRGQARSFCIPTFRGDLRLSNDLAPAETAMVVEPTELTDASRPGEPGDPFLALVTFDLADLSQPPAIEPVKWNSADISGTVLSLAAPLAQSHPVDSTIVSSLVLARFNDPKITWTYKTDGLATAKIKFLELTNEYGSPQAELSDPVFLYRFTYQLATPQYFYFTSYENTFAVGSGSYAGSYLPAPFSHGSIKTSVKLDNEQIELDSFAFAGNPLALFLPFQLEAPLWLDVLEANAASPSAAPTVIFTGEVYDVESKGAELKATCMIFGRYMDKDFPSYIVSQVCNYSIYSPAPRCGVNKATFANTGNLSALGTGITTINIAAGSAKPANYFANGFLETGTGSNFERRTILSSVASGGGTQLVIDYPLLKAVNGQSASAYPGCNGTKETCAGVFNNLTRMGAFPFVPDINPTIKAMNAKNATGGKKG